MRTTFLGYYRFTEEEFSTLWEDCLFIFDANVILNLYRYSAGTSEALLNILRGISDRMWLPHQIALEYQDNRGSFGSQGVDTIYGGQAKSE
jgi:hypothetical protein